VLYNSSVVVQLFLHLFTLVVLMIAMPYIVNYFTSGQAVLVFLIIPCLVKVKTFTSRGLHYLPSIFLIIMISDLVKVKTFTSLSFTSD
jgi:hypothetical protein